MSLTLTHEQADRRELERTQADLRARCRDVEQVLMLEIEAAVKRAAFAYEMAGALDRWLYRGQWPVRCTPDEVASMVAEEIATDAVETLTQFRNADARDAFKMGDD